MAGSAVIASAMRICSGVSARDRSMATPRLRAAARPALVRSRLGLTARGHKFRFKNCLLSLDASVIDLCVSVFDWAQFQRTKGAIKLHLLLDHAGYLPSFAVITTGKTHDLRVARQLEF